MLKTKVQRDDIARTHFSLRAGEALLICGAGCTFHLDGFLVATGLIRARSLHSRLAARNSWHSTAKQFPVAQRPEGLMTYLSSFNSKKGIKQPSS